MGRNAGIVLEELILDGEVMSTAYELATPFIALAILIVGLSNWESNTAPALFVASFWIFTGPAVKS